MNNLTKALITEKSLLKTKDGVYVFQVKKSARKEAIKDEIEKMFNVKVTKIATVLKKGKIKRAGRARKEFRKPAQKKAIVTLFKDQKIDLFPKV